MPQLGGGVRGCRRCTSLSNQLLSQHEERENQPDFEDQHRATWHLNPEIPIQRTEQYFDAVEHVCWPLAWCYLLVHPLSICNENEDGLVWSPAHLSSVKYWNIFLLEIGHWLSSSKEESKSFLSCILCPAYPSDSYTHLAMLLLHTFHIWVKLTLSLKV